jgi:hypothetical protein
MVAAAARLGCDADKRPSKERRFFLIPASEYAPGPSDKAPRFAFVINLEKHKEIPPIS